MISSFPLTRANKPEITAFNGQLGGTVWHWSQLKEEAPLFSISCNPLLLGGQACSLAEGRAYCALPICGATLPCLLTGITFQSSIDKVIC